MGLMGQLRGTQAIHLLFGASVLVLAGTTAAQDTTGFTVTDIEVTNVLNFFPAPDGIHAIYQTAGSNPRLTLVDMSGAEDPVEIQLPREEEDFPLSVPDYSGTYFTPLTWSPDSSLFAFVGTDYRRFYEGDLWIYDIEGHSWFNTTDDSQGAGALEDFLFDRAEPGATLSVESEPAWAPDNSAIAFERYVFSEDGPIGPTIALLDLYTGEVEDLVTLPQPESGESAMGSVIDLVWSPDATMLYVSILSATEDVSINGIYVVSVEEATIEMLLSAEDMVEALEDASGAEIGGRTWAAPMQLSPDGEQLVLWLSTQNGEVQDWAFIYEIEQEFLAPIIPFTGLVQGGSPNLIPLHTAWSPDSQSVLLVVRPSSVPLGDIPTLLPGSPSLVLARYTVQTGMYRPIGLLSARAAVPKIGSWSEAGQALIGAYQFTIQ